MKPTLVLWLAILFSPFGYAQVPNGDSQPAGSAGSNKTASQSESTESGPRAQVKGNLEVLTDTQGVDFGPYLSNVIKTVREDWYKLIPEQARPPEKKAGKVSIEFVILRDGHVAGMTLREPSGDVALDRAAWGGIANSAPFAPLPSEFHGPYLALRFHFVYNPGKIPTETAKPEQK
jgi:TonB family protein